jgi:viroplasmin and RNaseH domain-containing protein
MSGAKGLEPFRKFESDEEAERFVDEADLSEYDFRGSSRRISGSQRSASG